MLESDIIYKDNLITILNPNVSNKGILIWSNYVLPKDNSSLHLIGLKTGYQLQKEGINIERTIFHPYIFFRAPYFSREIDYTSIYTEIYSLYGLTEENIKKNKFAFIRVDPDNTYVFSSEIRNIYTHPTLYGNVDNIIYNSKKTLTTYLQIIKENKIIENNKPNNKKILYHLFSSKAYLHSSTHKLFNTTFDSNPINYNSEILVSIPHLTPEYFVLFI